jgi:hypothetical protein
MENRLSPIRELLGELLLEANEPAKALREFETSLRNNPNRYRSFAGAAKAAERVGIERRPGATMRSLSRLRPRQMMDGPPCRREAVSRGELTRAKAVLRTRGLTRCSIWSNSPPIAGPRSRPTNRTSMCATSSRGRSPIRLHDESFGRAECAGLHKLHQSHDLTILNVVWAPMMTIMPHNHSMWAVIGIYTGREDNIFWRRLPDGSGKVEAAGAQALCERDARLSDATSFTRSPIRFPA